jgi:phospholipase C
VTEPNRSAEQSPAPQQQPQSQQGQEQHSDLTRRGLIAGASVAGAAAVLGSGTRTAQPTAAQSRLIEAAVSAAAGNASLSDVKHLVILMQENRSFDHYFGTLSGVRGFSDPDVPTQTVNGVAHTVFDQFGFRPGSGASATGYMQPFRLLTDPPLEEGRPPTTSTTAGPGSTTPGTAGGWMRSSSPT